MSIKNLALIVAAGDGTRMKKTLPKQYLSFNKKPVLLMVIEKFLENTNIDFVKVVIARNHLARYSKVISNISSKKLLPYELGGETRAESVFKGLEGCKDLFKNRHDKVLIHDAARPFISHSLINNLISKLKDSEAVFPTVPIHDALWYKIKNKYSTGPERQYLHRAQTPQGFYFMQYKDLCKNFNNKHIDDISIAQMHKLKISSISGDPMNIKLTTPDDLKFAERIIQIWT